VSQDQDQPANSPPIYIVSGGVGASGEQLVQTVLAQFPETNVPVVTVGNVRQMEQIESVVAQAQESDGTVVHTLVDAHLRNALTGRARAQGVVAIDLVGALLSRLAEVLEREPLGQPGLYRMFHRAHFERVAAIEFAMTHDDGKNPQGWSQADVVLVGVSRTGKTPLSVYLSVLGWKMANVPIVLEWPTPPELFQLDRRRVVGLTIDPDQLLMYREQRYRRMGALAPSAYVDPEKIRDEIQAALRIFHQHGFAVIDVTDKPIETSADEIIKLITRQMG
jgi:regulator of PEP synthase PpsR (kinase-PPPase family)